MKIIYTKNVSNVSNIGGIKEVADGYAQNFLFPKGLALPATKENIDKLKNSQKKREKEAVLDLAKTKRLARRVEGLRFSFKKNTNEKGTLFAAISENDICSELEKRNIKISPKNLKLNQHIKEIGEHQAILYLNHGLAAEISIVVERK